MKRDKRNLIIRKATWEETRAMNTQYFNPPLVIEYGKLFELNAGYGDKKTIFSFDNNHKIAVLSTNSGLDYAGLQVIDLLGETGDDDVFIQDVSSQENGCRTFFDRSESWQADYMAQYLGW